VTAAVLFRAALERLADAAEAAMSSDDDMPSHESTMTEFDDALDAARALLIDGRVDEPEVQP